MLPQDGVIPDVAASRGDYREQDDVFAAGPVGLQAPPLVEHNTSGVGLAVSPVMGSLMPEGGPYSENLQLTGNVSTDVGGVSGAYFDISSSDVSNPPANRTRVRRELIQYRQHNPIASTAAKHDTLTAR